MVRSDHFWSRKRATVCPAESHCSYGVTRLEMPGMDMVMVETSYRVKGWYRAMDMDWKRLLRDVPE